VGGPGYAKKTLIKFGTRLAFPFKTLMLFDNCSTRTRATEFEGLFVQVLLLAREMGLLKLGTLGLDDTRIHAKASRIGPYL
jgi:hypothetical protein